MTYPTGGTGYPPSQQPGGYPPAAQFAKPDDESSNLPMYLLVAVAALGLVGYLASFGQRFKTAELGPIGGSEITGGSFEVVALVLAALLAAASLLPKQRRYTAIIAVIALVGFLMAISEIINKPAFLSVGWGLIAIVIVAGLQSIVAVGALLLDAGVIASPQPKPRYDQYSQYGGYYGQPAGAPSQPTAQGAGQRPSYPQYSSYPQGPTTGGFSAAAAQSGPPTPPTGFPSYAQPPSPASAGGAPEGAVHEQSTHVASTQPPVRQPSQQASTPHQPSAGPPPS